MEHLPQIIQNLYKKHGVYPITHMDAIKTHGVNSAIFFFAKGCYHPYLDKVILNVDYEDFFMHPNKEASQIETALHELIHWSGNVERLCRPYFYYCFKPTTEHFLNETKIALPTEEATAQLGMLMLVERLGLLEPYYKRVTERYLLEFPTADKFTALIYANEAVNFLLK